ncbi:MAG: hypothetical protein IJP20_04955 [Clostridia bacterium]|nr:hypothetical protein [Clostridia bacterium]
MQQNKAMKALSFTLALLISMAVGVALFSCGLLLTDHINKTLSGIIAAVSFVLIVAAGIVNAVLTGKLRKKYNKLNIAEGNKMLLDRKSDIAQDLQSATERLEKAAKVGKIYISLITALMLVFIFFLGALANAAGGLFIFPILIIISVITRFFGALIDVPKPENKEILDKKDYPELYAIAQRARDEAELEGDIGITTDNSFNAAITKIGNQYYLLLGCSLVNHISRDELYNILLHEFAHHSEKYTPKSPHGFFNRFITYESVPFPLGDFFISYPMLLYFEEYIIYTALANEYIEKMADSITVAKGDPRAFASAIAKCNLHSQYERLLYQYQEKALFETEEPQTDIAEQYMRGFRRALEENQEIWLDMFEREIQPRNASHPIYRARRDAVGVSKDDVVISLDVSGDGLDAEREKITAQTNSEILQMLTPNYSELRKQNYLTPLSIIDDWEKNKENYPKTELTKVIQAMIDIMRHEDAEKLCDHIIENEENIYLTAFPKSFKGYLLVNREDPRGVDLLYESIELNSNLFEISIDPIGEYACRNGLQDVLDEYREKALALAQKNVDEDEQANSVSAKDNLVPDDMSEDALRSHIEFITSVSDSISGIYLVKKVISDTFYSHVFLIEFENKTPGEVINESMNRIFRYLDTLDNEQYSLFLYAPIYKSVVKKVDGSKIYSKNKK